MTGQVRIHYPVAGTKHGPRLDLACSCGHPAWKSCTGDEPGQRRPDHRPDDDRIPTAPLLGILLAVLVVIGAAATGVAWLLELW